MNDFSISFACFFALALVVPWALAYVLWRRIGDRPRAVRTILGSMAGAAIAVGALWWMLAHPALWPSPPPVQPNFDPPPRWGLAILAGVAGGIAWTIGTLMVFLVVAMWERISPGTLARLQRRLDAWKPGDTQRP
jgi:hypothetical protein